MFISTLTWVVIEPLTELEDFEGSVHVFLHCLCQGGTGVVLFLQTVGRLVKDLDFFIVCVCLGGGGGSSYRELGDL